MSRRSRLLSSRRDDQGVVPAGMFHAHVACCFSAMDDADSAYDSMEAALGADFCRLAMVREHPDLEALRQHPKFNRLLNFWATRIYEAARRGDLGQVIRWLDQDGSKDEAAPGGKTLLYGAAHHGQSEVVAELLRRGADKDKATDAGVTPLMAAADGMHWDVLTAIISDKVNPRAVNVNAADKTGMTALHIAASQTPANMDAIKLLYKHGANPLAETAAKQLPIDMGTHTPDGHGSEVQKYLARVTGAAQLVEGSGLKEILGGISIVAVLVVTVTFIGVLTPPGGPSAAAGLVRFSADSAGEGHPRSAALRAYFFFNCFSLFGAATDLLLVLLFTLPGISRRYRGVHQVRLPPDHLHTAV